MELNGDSSLNFVEGDQVYLIDRKDHIKYKVLKIFYEKDGNFHDGFSDNYYANLLNTNSGEVTKHLVSYINLMCGIKKIFAVKVDESY